MFVDEPISPELALVDPELAERLRRRMLAEDAAHEAAALVITTFTSAPEPPEPQRVAEPAAVQTPAGGPAPFEPASAAAGGERRRIATRRLRGVHVANGLATALVVLIALVPLLAFLPPRQAPSVGASADAATSAPQPRTLAWPAQPHADYYVVQLLRGGRVVWTSIPQEPTVDLPAALSAGTYTWRVESGFGPIDRNEHRGPIATGTLAVEAP